MWGEKSGALLRFVTMPVLAAMLCASGAALARNTNERVCLRPVRSVPINWQPPDIDGTLVNDLGWTAAWRYQVNDGTTSPVGEANVDAGFQIISDAEWIYFSAEVFDDISLDNSDRVLLGFDVSDTNRELWSISPRGGAPDPSQPVIQRYRWISGAWTLLAAPATTVIASTTVGTNPYAWSIEIKIPRNSTPSNGILLPNDAEFGVYMNAVRIWQTASMNDAVEFYWPNAPGYLSGDIMSVPPVDQWGTGSFSTKACGGLWFTSADIWATHQGCTTHCSDRTYIAHDRVNNLHVTVHNDTVDSAGTGVTATNVKANFRIANFGLTNHWEALPASVTQPVIASIAAGGSADGISGDWTPGAAYATPETDHQCILVELEGTGSLTFRNKSQWQNMAVGTASTFDGRASINAKGFKAPKRGGSHQEFVITADAQTSFRLAGSRDPIPGQIVEELIYVFNGYRVTGDQITINKKSFRILEATPGFGYRVHHRATDEEARAAKEAIEMKNPEKMPKTSPERWKLAAGGLTPIRLEQGAPRGSYQLYSAKVPVNGKLDLKIVVTSPGKEETGGGGGGGGGGCCPPAGGGNTTPTKVSMLGLPLLVGAIILRRRRRR